MTTISMGNLFPSNYARAFGSQFIDESPPNNGTWSPIGYDEKPSAARIKTFLSTLFELFTMQLYKSTRQTHSYFISHICIASESNSTSVILYVHWTIMDHPHSHIECDANQAQMICRLNWNLFSVIRIEMQNDSFKHLKRKCLGFFPPFLRSIQTEFQEIVLLCVNFKSDFVNAIVIRWIKIFDKNKQLIRGAER